MGGEVLSPERTTGPKRNPVSEIDVFGFLNVPNIRSHRCNEPGRLPGFIASNEDCSATDKPSMAYACVSSSQFIFSGHETQDSEPGYIQSSSIEISNPIRSAG